MNTPFAVPQFRRLPLTVGLLLVAALITSTRVDAASDQHPPLAPPLAAPLAPLADTDGDGDADVDEDAEAEVSPSALADRAWHLRREGEWENAIALLQAACAADAASSEWAYRLACLQAARAGVLARDKDDADKARALRTEAIASLKRAVELGFNDGPRLVSEPDLANLHGEPDYDELERPHLAARQAAAEQAAGAIAQRYAQYSVHTDARAGIVVVSNLPEAAANYVLKRLASLAAAHWREHLRHRSASFLNVVLPTPAAFKRMSPNPDWGGWYEHYNRTLIAQNLAYTLTHEFTHALHYSDLEAQLGQTWWNAAHWFLEGFATAFEDCALWLDEDSGEERLVPYINPRMSIAKKVARGRGFVDWRDLFKQDEGAFDPNVGYAEAGTLFRWLHETGRLRAVLDEYVKTLGADATGQTALMNVFRREIEDPEDAAELELEDLEDDWKKWVRKQDDPQPLNYEPSGVPKLGVRGDGCQTGLLVERVEGAARKAGVNAGDILLSCGGLPVDNQAKLNEALAVHKNGHEVELVVLRGDDVLTLTARLGR